MAKISVVMANYNRRQLLINTLKTIEYYNKDRDIEVIVVDDNSIKSESVLDVPDLFRIPVIIIPVTKEEKIWLYDGIVFNIGFTFITGGDIVIIQNPENLHVGDIVGYALKNLKDGIFLSFALYSMNQKDTNDLIKKTIAKGIYSGPAIKKAVGRFTGMKEQELWTDGTTCWYNHSVYHISGSHLISAITRKDLEDMNGFDERYAHGFAYSDVEFRERLKKKGMITKIIDDPLAIHQRHELAKYQLHQKEFLANGELFSNGTRVEKKYRAPRNYFYRPQYHALLSKCNEIDICPISGDEDAVSYFNLGDVPLVNNLCKTREESLSCDRYPLGIQIFKKSRLTCLTEIVDKNNLFLNYTYQSGVNKPFLTHCAEMYDYLDKWIKFMPLDLIVDVGGNDGSLLLEFKKKNPELDYLNIDASKSFIEINKKAGINYINKFFDGNFLLKEGFKAKLITSTNVFQHTLPIRSFVKGIYNNLEKDGIWCLEFPYLLTTLLNDNYDQVYHEHIFYFILSNIVDLLGQERMKVINVSFHNIHAGTLRVLSVKDTDKRSADDSVSSFLNLEKSLTPDYCLRWGIMALQKIQHFKSFIEGLKKEKKVIFGFGAAAKGCVFLNSVGIDYTTISYIIDDTPVKQGRFVPGTGIQVMNRSILKKHKVDYILILAHNFRDYIIDSLKNEYSGKFIIMFPDIKII
jgi:GT2 family glycosyltransferase